MSRVSEKEQQGGQLEQIGIGCFYKSQGKIEYPERSGQHCLLILKGNGWSPEKRPLHFIQEPVLTSKRVGLVEQVWRGGGWWAQYSNARDVDSEEVSLPKPDKGTCGCQEVRNTWRRVGQESGHSRQRGRKFWLEEAGQKAGPKV